MSSYIDGKIGRSLVQARAAGRRLLTAGRWCLLFPLLLALTAFACRVTDLPLWRPGHSTLDELCEVEEVHGVPYYQGSDADPYRHRVDLYLPKGRKDFPVVMLVHGGSWFLGDNRCCGLYPSVGQFLASCGIGAVLPNYRLSPHVQHPEHIKDVARAFAWTHAHIAEHGGRPDQIFLAGHSAGGHLVALLATDERYLQAEGLKTTDIRGVIALSGVYRLAPGNMDAKLGGSGPLAFRWDEMFPLRGSGTKILAVGPGIPVCVNVYGLAFGDDPKVRTDASPLTHVRPGLPPFLIMSAGDDLPTLPEMAVQFHKTLEEKGCTARFVRVEDRNHNSIMFRAIAADDPVARAMLDFVRANAAAMEPTSPEPPDMPAH